MKDGEISQIQLPFSPLIDIGCLEELQRCEIDEQERGRLERQRERDG